jgi:hypothetical protein
LAYIRYKNNPFDFKKGKILGLDDMGKGKKRYLKLKHRKNKHPDAEVQKLIDDVWELHSFSYLNTVPT